MRVSIGQLFDLTDEGLAYCAQLGVAGITLLFPNTPDDRLDFIDFVQMKARCEEHGLRLESIEQIPNHLLDDTRLGKDTRDAQIENYQRILGNIGRAGIPVLGLHWLPNFVWRTSNDTPIRGGAHTSSFDLERVRDAPLTHGRVYPREEMWDNFGYFMDRVLPVAEDAGVTLALHPDDPPVDGLGGIARIFSSFEDFKVALDRWDSPSFKVLYCMGTWSEMGPIVPESLQYFGERDKISYVHFRDVKGHVPSFCETFIGTGNVDVVQAIEILRDTGFDGWLIEDHSPRMQGDPEWCTRGRTYSTGYIAGLVRALCR
jgi:mannonate dehydratase